MFQKLKIKDNAYTIISYFCFPHTFTAKLASNSCSTDWIFSINVLFMPSWIKLSLSWMHSIYFV